MISDITLGQFFPGDSVIHRLDPRTKIIFTVIFIVAVFLASTPISFLVLILSTALMIALSKISFKVILIGSATLQNLILAEALSANVRLCPKFSTATDWVRPSLSLPLQPYSNS